MAIGLSDFYADCRKYGETFAKTAAYEAKNLLYLEATAAIDNFYGSYSPQIYVREFNIKNNSFKDFYRNHGKRFVGGVMITPERMHEYYPNHSWSNETIADMVWRRGYHTPKARTVPPPLSAVEKHLDQIRELCIQKGEQAALNQSYSVIDFS